MPQAHIPASLADLVHYHRNPRPGDLGAICSSLSTNGQYRPIVVNKGTLTGRANEVLAGKHTLKAARHLGWEQIAVTWLDVDLTQHCLKAFAECDRHNVTHRRRTQTLLLPADNPPAAWYLCALPTPWDWGRNAHLAFEHAPGDTWEGDATVPGLRVKLTNARPITGWGEHSIPLDVPLRSGHRYRTCRN
ncbi:ParB N-terminal domain-containing protein [Streptomyces sp. NBC_00237]|uniref:ParB N-terminal domain-containing protein n=1 Tax=Streptomyces sp. NBC_00237 TaxID=2975687 RepID=UPI0022557668|nr:ParB N-terminal domain-containing protein [Streptomyces sp. NBC_00237]MCX5206110.1 ParB N-terminal domain-containing protein [Streptomyces sp. NBC_00237]